MKKKIFAVIALGAALMASLVSCGTCKEKGCDEKVYKDGYCETHYAIKVAGDIVDGLNDMFG